MSTMTPGCDGRSRSAPTAASFTARIAACLKGIRRWSPLSCVRARGEPSVTGLVGQLRHRDVPLLADALAANNGGQRSHEDAQIEPDRPMVDVPDVELQPVRPGRVVPAIDLRPASDARTNVVAPLLARRVAVEVLHEERTGPHQAHL